MNALLDSVADVMGRRAKERSDAFRKLAKSVVDGPAPAPEQIARALEECGKSVEDLKRAVALRNERLKLRAEVDAAVAAEEKADRARRDLESEAARFAELEAKHNAIVGPLVALIQAGEMIQQNGMQARQRLASTCDDPRVLEEIQRLQVEGAHVRGRRDYLAKSHREACSALDDERERLSRAHRDERTVVLSRVEAALDAVESLDAELKTVTAEAEAIDRREAALREEMLNP